MIIESNMSAIYLNSNCVEDKKLFEYIKYSHNHLA